MENDPCTVGQATCELPADVLVRPVMQFVKISVEIIDVNDNAPTFATGHSTLYVSEATLPGQLLFPVQSAYDVDSPRFGVVGYRLVATGATVDTFQLTVDRTQAGGFDVRVVLREKLDREQRNFYQLQVGVDRTLRTFADANKPAVMAPVYVCSDFCRVMAPYKSSRYLSVSV